MIQPPNSAGMRALSYAHFAALFLSQLLQFADEGRHTFKSGLNQHTFAIVDADSANSCIVLAPSHLHDGHDLSDMVVKEHVSEHQDAV
jgi:hypothetical protein